MTTCDAAARPRTRHSTRRAPFLQATAFSPSPSTFFRVPRRILTPASGSNSSRLSRAAGLGGMVGGQMLDLAAEGRFDASAPKLGEQDVKVLQAMKTGALLRFGCVAGAVLGKANQSQRKALERYGSALGEAFQIADDLLDVEGDPATVGKATGKDAAAHKATLVGVLGPAAARRRLENLVGEAQAALAAFGSDGDGLKAAARFVATRSA